MKADRPGCAYFTAWTIAAHDPFAGLMSLSVAKKVFPSLVGIRQSRSHVMETRLLQTRAERHAESGPPRGPRLPDQRPSEYLSAIRHVNVRDRLAHCLVRL